MSGRRTVDESKHRCHFCGRIAWELVPVTVKRYGLDVTVGACGTCKEKHRQQAG